MRAQWIVDFAHAHACYLIRWRSVIRVRDVGGGNRKHGEVDCKWFAGFGLRGHRCCPFGPTNHHRHVNLARARHGKRINQNVVSPF